MSGKMVAIAGLLFASATISNAEAISCTGSNISGSPIYVHIESKKGATTHVWLSSDISKLESSPIKVLDHSFSGISGSEGLGVSSFVVKGQVKMGRDKFPMLIVVDWTSVQMAVSYVPWNPPPGDMVVSSPPDKTYAEAQRDPNLLIAREDFYCRRLD